MHRNRPGRFEELVVLRNGRYESVLGRSNRCSVGFLRLGNDGTTVYVEDEAVWQHVFGRVFYGHAARGDQLHSHRPGVAFLQALLRMVQADLESKGKPVHVEKRSSSKPAGAPLR